MQTIRQYLAFLIGGMTVSATLASFIAPPLVKLTHAPISESSALCNCTTLADNMIRSLFKAQLVGLVLGAVLGVIVLVLLKRRGKLR